MPCSARRPATGQRNSNLWNGRRNSPGRKSSSSTEASNRFAPISFLFQRLFCCCHSFPFTLFLFTSAGSVLKLPRSAILRIIGVAGVKCNMQAAAIVIHTTHNTLRRVKIFCEAAVICIGMLQRCTAPYYSYYFLLLFKLSYDFVRASATSSLIVPLEIASELMPNLFTIYSFVLVLLLLRSSSSSWIDTY